LQCLPKRGSDLEKKVKAMTKYLGDHFPKHDIQLTLLKIEEDDLTNYEIVAEHLRSFLQTLNLKDEIEVITGTGSAIMQMALVALFYSMDLRFQLYLMHHNPIKYPDPIPIRLTKSKELDEKLKEISLREAPPANLVTDKSLRSVYKRAEIWAKAIRLNILILGETGTGKDLLAKHIVENSPLSRKNLRL
jgi:DNA-binding NtrC family response regulator